MPEDPLRAERQSEGRTPRRRRVANRIVGAGAGDGLGTLWPSAYDGTQLCPMGSEDGCTGLPDCQAGPAPWKDDGLTCARGGFDHRGSAPTPVGGNTNRDARGAR